MRSIDVVDCIVRVELPSGSNESLIFDYSFQLKGFVIDRI